MDPWPMIEADRLTLADYLSGLPAEDWEKQSLCTDWTVKEAAAHMLVVPTVPKSQVFLNFLLSGFNLNRFSARMVDKIAGENSPEEIVEKMRSEAGSRNVPPGLKPMGALSEVLVHSGDISEGAGRPLAFPADHYTAGLDYLKNIQPALGCRKRIEGLELRATDADWVHGEGPLVEGTAQYLTLAMTGRKAALDHLSGDGVAVMRSRD